MSANTEKASAGRNLLVYAALVAVAAAYTALLWAQRDDLESYRYPTGLGDGELYDLEANPLDPDKPMVKLGGVAYFAADRPESLRDRFVVPVGRDDDDRYFFYEPTSEIGGGGEEEGGGLYIKLDRELYIRVAPKENVPPPPASE